MVLRGIVLQRLGHARRRLGPVRQPVAAGEQRRQRGLDGFPGGARIGEAHLGLRRMHVDVHLRWRDLEKKDRARVPAVRHQLAVSAQHRVRQRAVANRAPIDEKPDIPGTSELDRRRDRQPSHADSAHFRGHGCSRAKGAPQ